MSEDKYNKQDVIHTKPFGLVIVVKRLRDSKGTIWYIVHTIAGSEFQIHDPFIKGLATEAEANAFRNKYVGSVGS